MPIKFMRYQQTDAERSRIFDKAHEPPDDNSPSDLDYDPMEDPKYLARLEEYDELQVKERNKELFGE